MPLHAAWYRAVRSETEESTETLWNYSGSKSRAAELHRAVHRTATVYSKSDFRWPDSPYRNLSRGTTGRPGTPSRSRPELGPRWKRASSRQLRRRRVGPQTLKREARTLRRVRTLSHSRGTDSRDDATINSPMN